MIIDTILQTVTTATTMTTTTTAVVLPTFPIPDATFIVTLTSIGLGLLTQLVTKRIVNLDEERRLKAELSAFNKEKREATLAKDKAKLDKLNKRELQVRQAQAKVSLDRLKVTAITIVPLFGVYYLMANLMGGFGVLVAYTPVPIPFIAGVFDAAKNGWEVSLFWWYLLSSFTFSSILGRLLRTTT